MSGDLRGELGQVVCAFLDLHIPEQLVVAGDGDVHETSWATVSLDPLIQNMETGSSWTCRLEP